VGWILEYVLSGRGEGDCQDDTVVAERAALAIKKYQVLEALDVDMDVA